MSRQLQEIEDNIEALEDSKDQSINHLEEMINMLKELKGDLFPSICEDYKTKKDGTN